MKKTIFYSIFAMAIMSSCAGSSADKTVSDSVDVVSEEVVEAVVDSAGNAVVVLTDVAQLEVKDKPVIVDFNAVWCGPCQKFAPNFESVAKKNANSATFISVDVDKWQDVAMKYNAQSIPMIVIIKPNGETVSQVGYMTEAEFEEFVNQNI